MKQRSPIFALLLLTFFASCSRYGRNAGQLEPVTVGMPSLEQNALLYVADHEGFFAEQGLKVMIKEYDSGASSIAGMLRGEADIAEAAEFPFVRAVLEGIEIAVLACNDKFENDYLVARKDRGITELPALAGKRIGVALKTINEFYLGRLLALNGLNLKQVTLVDTRPAEFVEAFASGTVDAIIVWQPYAHKIEKEVGGTVVWPAQSSQAAYGLLVCRSEWVRQHADTVRRLLKSLHEGEDYLLRHPGEAKAIVKERLNYDDSYIAAVWPQHNFVLSLDLTLIIAMKDEAQWLINNNLTQEKAIPDFAATIYLDGLKAVKPEAVSIDH